MIFISSERAYAITY